MGSDNLELAFYGHLLEGFAEADVKQNVATMFKASVEQVERMFTGNRVVIRNKLDPETAQKYVSAMAKRGAICKIEVMGQPGQEYHPEPADGAVAAEAAAPIDREPSSDPAGSNEAPPTAPAPSAAPPQAKEDKDAGKMDEILSNSQLDLEPVGVRLSDESEPAPEVELKVLANVAILPPGSDLQDEKEEKPVSVPDISHISLKTPDE